MNARPVPAQPEAGAGERRLLFDQHFLKQLERLRFAALRAASARARGPQLRATAGRSLEIMD